MQSRLCFAVAAESTLIPCNFRAAPAGHSELRPTRPSPLCLLPPTRPGEIPFKCWRLSGACGSQGGSPLDVQSSQPALRVTCCGA